jgi:hypothetical protein
MDILLIRGTMLASLFVLVLGFTSTVQADFVTWHLSGVTFEDGGTATGSFKYDALANSYSDISITTTQGTAFSGNQYIDKVNVNTPLALISVSAPAASDLTEENFFVMQFSSALTASGGTISLAIPGGNNREGVCTSTDCYFGNTFRSTIAGNVTTTPIPPLVIIDVAPGKHPNIINLKSGGFVRVAILSQGIFDAIQVDPTTTKFGPSEIGSIRYKVKDVDYDGDEDLLLSFRIQQTGIVCSDTEASLIGELYDGTPITGTDFIQTKNCL